MTFILIVSVYFKLRNDLLFLLEAVFKRCNTPLLLDQKACFLS